jgi:hypothetical protein
VRLAFICVISISMLATDGCGNFEPPRDAPLAPPATYATWWQATEACSGLHGDFAAVDWYVVPGTQFDCPTGTCVGRWESNGRIYLAAGAVMDEQVVRHEMLHALIGRPGHPDPPFGKGCGLLWTTWSGRPASDALVTAD